ncbi:hypothetical protein [Streptomyces sp. SID8352]|uniref:hypothetical protein n=1 Tax=Streptomyces sp. SID8352 TaxID=2690338 RepID=UPI0019253F4D|nr:hypothetical protein [Streptomyces sp. SID8352]
MPARHPTGPAPWASGLPRLLGAGAPAVLCVLLPLAGHLLNRCHAPRWILAAAVMSAAVPGAVLLTRRRLSDAQALGILLAAQLVADLAYTLPGACRAMTGGQGAAPGPMALTGHMAEGGPPAGVLFAGHLITLLIAARLLGCAERLRGRGGPLLALVRRLLRCVRTVLGRVRGTGPRVTARTGAAALRSAVLARRGGGRAPPALGRALPGPRRAVPYGVPSLP